MPSPTEGSAVSTVAFTGNPQIDGLLIGTKWGGALGTGVAVGYSFPDADSVWSTVLSDPFGYDPTDPANDNPFASQYAGLNSVQQDAVRNSLLAWGHVAGITFVEVADNASVVGDIRVAFTNGGDIQDAYAYAYTPAPFAYGGDVWLNSVQPVPSGNDFSTGAAGYSTVLHELGHAIGLDHPFSIAEFPAALDSFKYSTMSYADFPGHQDTGASSLYPTTPMLLDIAALQYLYGPNASWNAGDDTYSFSEGGNYYETIWDAGGIDTVVYDSAGDGALIDLRAGNFSQLGAPIVLSDGSVQNDDVAIAFNVVIEIAIGGDGDDVIIGNAADNTLVGGMGNDALTGGSGNDWLDGGGGSDAMSGGPGDDTYAVDALDTVTEAAGAGADTIESAGSYVLSAANVENLTLTGIDAVDATGNALANTLTGNSGENVLDGLGGADRLIGGDGNDTYLVDAAGDRAVETSAAGGTDQVFSTTSFTLGANLENLTLSGGGATNAAGNALDNVLTGNSGGNLLDGEGGADTLIGGPGNDTYAIDADDTVVEAAGEGTDTIRAGFSYDLAANFENLVLIGVADIDASGNAHDNAIAGNAGDNIIDGDGGNDAMVGDAGNDTYYVAESGDSVTEAGASGGDDQVFSLVSFTLGANLENLTLMGGGAINGTGNDLDNTLTGNDGDNVLDGKGGGDSLLGGAGNDSFVIDSGDEILEADGDGIDTIFAGFTCVLADCVENLTLTGTGDIGATGNELDNLLVGNSGANLLDGAGGADTLAGGAGNDSYMFDGSDTLVEAASGGIDAVIVEFSYSLADHFENLVLAGMGNMDATGNAADNVLTGNAGDNILDGGGGNDTMIGGAGDDTYYYIEAGDVVLENGGGNDTVVSARSLSLDGGAAGIENITLLQRSAALAAIGNARDNVLTGNRNDNTLLGMAGDDQLIGLRGDDSMLGGAGNDSYHVDRGGDVVTEAARAGSDTVVSSVNYALGANLENLALTGYALIGAGNALNNILTGNARNNKLEGGAGNDTLDGGAGFDKLYGGAGNDSFHVDQASDRAIELAGGGIDTVRSTAACYQLGAEVENLVLEAGAGDAQGVGNGGNNVLSGNAGDNILAGGGGNDSLTGGAGADTFVFDSAPNAANRDTISDFVSGVDHLSLDNSIFTAIGADGALAATAFNAGNFSSGQDAGDRLIYNTSSGALYYDADGSGAIAAVQIATLAGAPDLLFSDLAVI